MQAVTGKITGILMGLLLLAGCSETIPDIGKGSTAATTGEIRIDAMTIDMIPQYAPSGSGDIDYLYDYKPSKIVEDWVQNTLRAAGGDKVLKVTIDQASVKEKKIARDVPGWKVWESDAQREYDAKLDVQMKLYSPEDAMPVAQIEIHVTRAVTIDDNLSLHAKKAVYDQLMKALAQDFDAEARKQVASYFGPYLR